MAKVKVNYGQNGLKAENEFPQGGINKIKELLFLLLLLLFSGEGWSLSSAARLIVGCISVKL